MPAKTTIPRGSHREQNARDAAQLYAAGTSIRQIADQLGLSYGGTYNLLRYAGVKMRPRGGPRRKQD